MMKKSRRVFLTVFLFVALSLCAGAFKYRRALRDGVHQAKSDGVRQTLKTAAKTVYHSLKSAAADAQAAPLPLPERADAPLPVFSDVLGDGWQDWSWATHTVGAAPSPHSGTAAITMTPTEFKGVYLHHDALSLDGYGFLTFAIKSKSPLKVALVDGGGNWTTPVSLPSTGGAWQIQKIALPKMAIKRTGSYITGVIFQDTTGGKSQPNLFIDDISFLPDPTLVPAPTSATVSVAVDMSKNRHAISPYIYGMSFAPPDYLADLRLTVNRWGGNDKTRYNWAHGNADNAARDWNFANRKAIDGAFPEGPSSAADYFTELNKKGGAQTFLTVPTIGWVSKDTNNNNTSQNVPGQGGEPLPNTDGAIKGYDPTANRLKTSFRSVPRKKNAAPGVIAQDEWISHLTQKWGKGNAGGVKFYAMDNEPDLWDYTHTDVHPARMGYDDLLTSFYDYASAVKDADPTALVTGPVSWGWTGYLYSPLDKGDDNYHTYADRKKHGDIPFLAWFLQQVKNRDTKAGRRTLDVLDVHIYPQGQNLYSGAHDADAQKRRLRSTRALWDANYKDESWIGEPVRLVPRLRDWITQNYPGTKIGVTEWNFGGDTDISGGLASLDVLGTFARENVYLANYWAYPTKGGASYLAFKLMRNPDNAGHGFGETSGTATSTNDERVSSYVAARQSDGALTLLLVNKMPKAIVSVPVRFAPGSVPAGATATVFRLTSAGKEIAKDAKPLTLQNNALTVSLPPYSAALVCVGGK